MNHKRIILKILIYMDLNVFLRKWCTVQKSVSKEIVATIKAVKLLQGQDLNAYTGIAYSLLRHKVLKMTMNLKIHTNAEILFQN